MHRFQVLLAVVLLGLVVSAAPALADGPSAGSSGIKVAPVSFIDPELNILQLSDGTELKVYDPRMLADLRIGEWVKVDYVSDGERTVLNSIAPAPADQIPASAARQRG